MNNLYNQLLAEMENYFGNDVPRISHAKNVLHYADKIMKKEGGEKNVIIPAAILHDIGILECEKKYQSTSGKLQEKESPIVAAKILGSVNYPQEYIKEILYIIGNHHSPGEINNLNFQILYEADWLVNLGEEFKDYSADKKEVIINKNFKTATGINLARKIYLNKEGK